MIIYYINLLAIIGSILYSIGKIIYHDDINQLLIIIFPKSLIIVLNIIITVSGYLSLKDWFNY